jgi:putative addiction module killer protein
MDDVVIIEIIKSKEFADWLVSMKDKRTVGRISAYIDRLKFGVLGDFKIVNSDIIEVRLHFGPGYRIYLHKENYELIVLLVGGDKSSQDRDVKRAEEILRRFKEEYNG